MLQRKVAIPLIYHTLDYLCKLAAICLYKLKVQYLLHIQTKQSNTPANAIRLERSARKCSNELEYLKPLYERKL